MRLVYYVRKMHQYPAQKVVVKRNYQCKLEWEDQGMKALYDTAVSAKQAADAPMAQAVV